MNEITDDEAVAEEWQLPLLLNDYIAIEPDPTQERVTPGGIVIPDNGEVKDLRTGTVVAVGPGALNADGSRTAPGVHEGDTVFYFPGAGFEVSLNHPTRRFRLLKLTEAAVGVILR